MDADLQKLKGSLSRDTFKHMHKQTHPQHFGCDLDFVCVQKYPHPDIAFWIDYKGANDKVTFSEAIAYNAMVIRGIRGFIVCGDPQAGCFDIYEFIGGHHSGPTWSQPFVCHVSSWDEYHNWEAAIRKECRDRFTPSEHTHGR
jgi:hypothetical protein